MLKITVGKKQKAQKVVLYGVEGIGKSTFASQFPNPLFIDTENSTDHMDVHRVERPTSWTMLVEMVREFVRDHGDYKTLVIDTIDWAETLCMQHICAKEKKHSIEDFGYGKGYMLLQEEIGRFLQELDAVIEAGVNVLLTAHCQIKKFEQPDEMNAYDRYELKLNQKTTGKVASLIKEWADMVLFANYKSTIINNNANKAKGVDSKRIMYAQRASAWDAKNRHGLPPSMPFDYEEIKHCIPNGTPRQEIDVLPSAEESNPEIKEVEQKAEVPKALADLMAKDGITVEQIENVVASRGKYPAGTPIANYDPDFVDGWLIPNWSALVKFVKENNL